jgi:segregation and condensation protein B
MSEYQDRGIVLKRVGSGYRFQAISEFSDDLAVLFKEKTPRYSRALLETLSLIAYKQPITRGEIEDIRGVAVSSHIINTLLEREWVKSVGHKDVPGRPALYGTTHEFLDYFSLASLAELPELIVPNTEIERPELENLN